MQRKYIITTITVERPSGNKETVITEIGNRRAHFVVFQIQHVGTSRDWNLRSFGQLAEGLETSTQ
jgi:hypothetical protein